jgi:hypothetical protein
VLSCPHHVEVRETRLLSESRSEEFGEGGKRIFVVSQVFVEADVCQECGHLANAREFRDHNEVVKWSCPSCRGTGLMDSPMCVEAWSDEQIERLARHLFETANIPHRIPWPELYDGGKDHFRTRARQVEDLVCHG